MNDSAPSYGSDATLEKLDAIQRYADVFTTALKDKPFTLVYVDAFAGSGRVQIAAGMQAGQVVEGSALLALDIDGRPFDQLLLIEKDADNAAALKRIIEERGEQDRTQVITADANDRVPQFCDWLKRDGQSYHRALVLLDPFATEVNWSTIKSLAKTERCDVLILVPLMAVRRLLKRDGHPSEQHAAVLDRIFGGRPYWENQLYPDTAGGTYSAGGYRPIIDLYVKRLATIFAHVEDPQRTLSDHDERTMFTLLGAVSNPGKPAVELAGRLMSAAFKAARGPQRRLRL